MAHTTPPPGEAQEKPSDENSVRPTARDIELLYILVSRKGTRVDAQWAIHPQLKRDLLPDEWNEVTDLLAKATGIVGSRFSEVLSKVEPATPGDA